jgi:hypothetical protein
MKHYEKYDHLPYNQRQFCRMRDAIDAYFEHIISLNDVDSTLTALLNVLENMSDGWIQQFQSHLNAIEEYYTVNIVMKNPITEDDYAIVHHALHQIRKMINPFLLDEE